MKYSPAKSSRLFGVLSLLWILPATAGEEVMEYYFHTLDGPAELVADHDRIDRLLPEFTRQEDAIVLMETLLAQYETLSEDDPLLYGKLQANLSMLLARNAYYPSALDQIDAVLSLVEPELPVFSPVLTDFILVRALILIGMDRFEDAELALRRAQNIEHRHGGVYTEEQLPIVQQLFWINYSQGRTMLADKQQFFTLRVSEQAYGEDSEDLLPVLQQLGNYFASRASRLPMTTAGDLRAQREYLFRTSRDLFLRAIDIVEDNYGPDDLRLVAPLKGLARMRYLQRTNNKKAKESLERAQSIVINNPGTDLSERVAAIVELGDLYMQTSDRRALETYRKAWNLLQQSTDHRHVAVDLFGTPTRLHPSGSNIVLISRLPDDASPDTELFIDAEYTVTATGRIANVQVLDKNVPNEQVRLLRSRLSAARYRPRIIDGEFVATDHLLLHQTYRVAGRSPSE